MYAIDPTIREALIAAHRAGTLMPGGTLESAIAEVRRLAAATRRQLREASIAADEMFARGISSAQYGGSTGALASVEHRADLLEDLERRRQHLAELEATLRHVELEDAADTASVIRFVRILARFTAS